MIDQVVDGLDALTDLPAVKRIAEINLVKRNVKRFENYLSKLSKKLASPFLSKLNWLNWTLINCLVLAFYVGQAHALEIEKWEFIKQEFKPIAICTLISGGLTVALNNLATLLKLAFKIFLLAVAIIGVGFLFYVGWQNMKEFFAKEKPERKDVGNNLNGEQRLAKADNCQK